MTSPETLELEAVDAALAGRWVAPEHAELADLALLLRDERPQPAPAWATHLDRRAAAGFPPLPKKRRQWVWLRQAAPVMAVFGILGLVGVGAALAPSGGDDEGGAGGGEAASTAAQEPVDDGSGGAGRRLSKDSGLEEQIAQPGSARADRLDARRVERFVNLTLAAPRGSIDRVASQIGDVTDELGGFVARSSVSSSRGGRLQLRIPSNRLDDAIQRLGDLARVRNLTRNTEDITAIVVSAREDLSDARAERKSLLRQLANAVTVNETESIRARLRIVRREIAAARTRLARANNRANFADVRVTLVPARGEDEGAWTPGDAFHDALRVLEVIAGVVLIAAAVALPLLVAWALGWLARRGVTRRRRERALDLA